MRNVSFGKPMIAEAEKQSVMDVLDGPILVHGPKAKAFEAAFVEFTGAARAVSVSSCTAAMHLAYFDFGLGMHDEVILPAQTHTATAHAVEFCQATPVFIDAELETGNLDLDQVEDAITPRTRAIAVVHFLGMPVDMGRVREIAQKHELFILEDCALAIGTYYDGVHAGLHGDAGCFSFYPVKHLTTAEGGMLITTQQQLADRIDRKKAFGVDRHAGERSIPGVYDVTMLGYNYRMNEIQAAIGIEQLKRIRGFLEKRKENYRTLSKELRQIEELQLLTSSHGKFQSSYYCLSVLLQGSLQNKRFEIVRHLQENGVGTSVYYPKPVPHMAYYAEKYGYAESSFPNAAGISANSIALPVGPHLDWDDMKYIAKIMKTAIVEVS